MRPIIVGAVFVLSEFKSIVGSAFKQPPIRFIIELGDGVYSVFMVCGRDFRFGFRLFERNNSHADPDMLAESSAPLTYSALHFFPK